MPSSSSFCIKESIHGKTISEINFKDIVCILEGYKTPKLVQFKDKGSFIIGNACIFY